ncbi:MAG: hypothetical protein ABMA64_37140 [Myxococcota bacterium]
MPTWLLVSLGVVGCGLGGALAAVFPVLVVRYARYRVAADRERSVHDLLAALVREYNLRESGPGIHEGRAAGAGGPRRLRCALREVEHPGGPRLQIAFGTPVPTGQLGVTHRTMVYGAEPDELELPPCKVGDPEFDVRFHLNADLEHLSILSPGVRRALMAAADDAEVRIREGWLWLDQPATPEVMGRATEFVDRLFAAAAALDGVPTEVEQRVRRLSQDDRCKVRMQTLELLGQRGSSEFTQWIAKGLLADPDAEVRARAAELCGDLERMVAIASDKHAPREVRSRVGRALASVGSDEAKLSAARGLCGGPMPLPTLSVELCRSVGAEAEAVLIEIVNQARGAPVLQAVTALGALGSARSMVVLQALVDGAEGVIRAEAKVALDQLRASAAKRKAPSPFTSTPPGAPRRGSDDATRVVRAPVARPAAGQVARPPPPGRTKR